MHNYAHSVCYSTSRLKQPSAAPMLGFDSVQHQPAASRRGRRSGDNSVITNSCVAGNRADFAFSVVQIRHRYGVARMRRANGGAECAARGRRTRTAKPGGCACSCCLGRSGWRWAESSWRSERSGRGGAAAGQRRRRIAGCHGTTNWSRRRTLG